MGRFRGLLSDTSCDIIGLATNASGHDRFYGVHATYASNHAVLMLTLHSKQADKHLHGHSAIQQSNTNAGPRARFQALDGICMQRSNCFTEGLADQPLFKGQLMQKSQLLYFRFSHCSPTSR